MGKETFVNAYTDDEGKKYKVYEVEEVPKHPIGKMVKIADWQGYSHFSYYDYGIVVGNRSDLCQVRLYCCDGGKERHPEGLNFNNSSLR